MEVIFAVLLGDLGREKCPIRQAYRTLFVADMACGFVRYYWHKPHACFMLARMDSFVTAPSTTPTWPPRLPSWALSRGFDLNESDAAFAAGIALSFGT
ncbi:hypothetical protein GOC46_32895 [Sinorhizobium meliloti]|nr:hypothetical protein [Sinorhizobium meliloti]MDX0384819.1 hypothetical protein [Sinorhizobium meliloti]